MKAKTMQTVNANRDFVSIGQLAAYLQKPVRAIEKAASELEMAPAMRINHIAHFDGQQVEQLMDALRNPNAKRN